LPWLSSLVLKKKDLYCRAKPAIKVSFFEIYPIS